MTLDGTDERIVALLVEDARIAVRAVAERLALPESTARARVKALIADGRVRPTIVVHPSVEDHRFLYMTRLRLSDPLVDLSKAPALSDAPWIARGTTEPTLFVQRAARSFDDMVAGIDAVAQLDAVAEATHSLFLRLFVGSNWSGSARTPEGWELSLDRDLDGVDRTLIPLLRRDARASYTALADRVGLTVAATRRRVLHLIESQAIRYVTQVLAPSGAETAANVNLGVAPQDLLSLARDLSDLTSVRYVAQQTGRHELSCHVVASSTQRLTEAVQEITGEPRVRASEVVPIATVRDHVSWVPVPLA
ncbi:MULTISPECIES: Lrp/AsnC family transcriptional regulator [unclassified Modestobacter]